MCQSLVTFTSWPCQPEHMWDTNKEVALWKTTSKTQKQIKGADADVRGKRTRRRWSMKVKRSWARGTEGGGNKGG